MEYSYGAELKRRELASWLESGMTTESAEEYAGNDPLIEFMLDCVPLCARYEVARQTLLRHKRNRSPLSEFPIDALAEKHEVHEEFLRRYGSGDPMPPTRPSFPTTCDECGSVNQIVDIPEEAQFACRVCGHVQEDYRIGHGETAVGTHNGEIALIGTAPYVYSHDGYFRKHLLEVQGLHKPPIPLTLVHSLVEACRARRIPPIGITPVIVRDMLHRLKQPQFYHCRWKLTKLCNPSYRLLALSHEITDRLEGLFAGMKSQFPHIVARLGMRRKNLPSYPNFARAALLHLGLRSEAQHFDPLKSQKPQALQQLFLHTVFRTLSRTSCPPLPPPPQPPCRPAPHSLRKRKRPPPSTARKPARVYAFSSRETRIIRAMKKPFRKRNRRLLPVLDDSDTADGGGTHECDGYAGCDYSEAGEEEEEEEDCEEKEDM